MTTPRIGQLLREDKLIGLVRQRLSIPGGCCSFDLPHLQLWLNLPQELRDRQISVWLDSLQPLVQTLGLILELIRNAVPMRQLTTLNGFYQDSGDDADLLRLQMNLKDEVYPQISGHKSRFAIRFLPFNSEGGTVPERIDFKLACC